MEKNLYIVRGLPGSGKSTFARSIAKSYQIFEADQYFMKKGKYNFDPTKLKEAHQDCKQRVANRMRENLFNSIFFNTIVVSNTFTQDWEMKYYRNIGRRYGYKVHTIIVENRHNGTNIHGVPSDKLQIMEDRFEIKLK
jgi:predicted kinase